MQVILGLGCFKGARLPPCGTIVFRDIFSAGPPKGSTARIFLPFLIKKHSMDKPLEPAFSFSERAQQLTSSAIREILKVTERPEVISFAGGLPAPTPALLAGALALGAISAVCHFLTVAAYQRADATVLAPFLYFNLLTAMTVGFLFFGETLGWTSIAGLLAIAGGGLVTLLNPAACAQ